MPADFCGTEGRGGENTCEQTLAVAAILSATAWIVGMREGGRSYVRRKLFDGSEVGDGCGRTYVGVNHGILRFPIVPLSVVNSIRIYCDASRVTRESSQSSPTRKAEGIEQARAVLPVRASKPSKCPVLWVLRGRCGETKAFPNPLFETRRSKLKASLHERRTTSLPPGH